MEIKLKPCPFCGGQASINKWYFPKDDYTVVCDSCGAMIYNNYMSEKTAAEAWNTRVKMNVKVKTHKKHTSGYDPELLKAFEEEYERGHAK